MGFGYRSSRTGSRNTFPDVPKVCRIAPLASNRGRGRERGFSGGPPPMPHSGQGPCPSPPRNASVVAWHGPWILRTMLRPAAGLRATLTRFAGLVFGLSVVALSSAAGCSSSENRYYCDDTGCYSCDGYGCTTVAAAAPTVCSGQASCPSGTTCTESGCLKNCAAEADCERGLVCKAGFCTSPTTTPGKAKECSSKADCGAGKICVENSCQGCGGESGPCPCAGASDCAADQTCSAGQCVAKTNVCRYASECASGQSCVNGQCVKPCADDAACAAGSACKAGYCQPKPPTGSCTSDAQCGGTTPKCLAGRCAAPCSSDGQCGAGNYCNQGSCAPDTRPKPICSAGDMTSCAASQSCVDGYCKYPCQKDDDCRIIDARIGYCGTDKVCRSPDEAKPQCTSQAECSASQSCVDNRCK